MIYCYSVNYIIIKNDLSKGTCNFINQNNTTMNNKYNEIYSSLVLLTACCDISVKVQHSQSTDKTTSTEKPNIVFILADNMGINDLGCYEQKLIKTSNIDKLAAHGLQFINHYSRIKR